MTLALLFITLGAIISLGVSLFIGAGSVSSYGLPIVGSFWVISGVLAIVLGFGSYYIESWLICKMTGSIFSAKADKEKTFGFLGYVQFLQLISSAATSLMSVVVFYAFGTTSSGFSFGFTGALGVVAIMGILAIAFFIWSLWVELNAISIANDVSLGEAFGAWLISVIIIGIIIGAIATTIIVGILIGGIAVFSL